jgi:type III pantothenate kinase
MGVLIAVDVGNSNTVVGAFRGEELIGHWRVQTNSRRTSDEYALMLKQLFELGKLELDSISGGIVASVVPTAVGAVTELFERHLKAPVHVVGPGTKTGMQILYENPREVGADRIVNAVAAFERHPQGCIVVDFGTATTWDVVSPKAQYLGGVIAPGIRISAEALYQRASKLPRVEITRPRSIIGRNTTASMQAGIYYGYAGMVDAVVERLRAEVDFEPAVLATGGLAKLIAAEAKTLDDTDELLTLHGLRLLFDRNH